MTRRTTTRLAKAAIAIGIVALAAAVWLFVTGGFDWDALLGAIVGVVAVAGGVLTLRERPVQSSDPDGSTSPAD